MHETLKLVPFVCWYLSDGQVHLPCSCVSLDDGEGYAVESGLWPSLKEALR